MGEVIQLDDHRPHHYGHAQCTHCGFKYIAVAPISVEDGMECKQCGRFACEFTGEPMEEVE